MLLRPVTRNTIHEGISFLNGTDTTRYWAVLPSLFAHWAKSNPDAVLNALEELRDAQQRDMLVWETFHALAATDAREALTTAGNLPSPMLRGPALHALAETLRPEQMPEILRESMKDARPPQQMRGASFQKDALKAWARSDPQAPVTFAAGIGDPSWRKEMLETALQVRRDLPLETGVMGKIDLVALLELARDSRNVPGITDQIGTLIGQGEPGTSAILAAMPSASDREYVMSEAMKDIFYFLEEKNGPDSMKKAAAEGLDNLFRETTAQGQSGEFQKAFFDAATSGKSRCSPPQPAG